MPLLLGYECQKYSHFTNRVPRAPSRLEQRLAEEQTLPRRPQTERPRRPSRPTRAQNTLTAGGHSKRGLSSIRTCLGSFPKDPQKIHDALGISMMPLGFPKDP